MTQELLSNECTREDTALARLTPREREILDHVLLHKPLKAIAFELGVTEGSVNQRLKSARTKLGANSRHEVAQIYSALLGGCRKSERSFQMMATKHDDSLVEVPEPPKASMFRLEDSGVYLVPPHWSKRGSQERIPEVLDEKFGRLWRIAAIPAFALVVALILFVMVAMSQSLGTIL